MGICVSSENSDARRLHGDAEQQLKKVCTTNSSIVPITSLSLSIRTYPHAHAHDNPVNYIQAKRQMKKQAKVRRLFQGCNPLGE
jgi:hypothetical protein